MLERRTSVVLADAAVCILQDAPAKAASYRCSSPLISILTSRLRQMLNQPFHLNLLVTAIISSLLEVSGSSYTAGCEGPR